MGSSPPPTEPMIEKKTKPCPRLTRCAYCCLCAPPTCCCFACPALCAMAARCGFARCLPSTAAASLFEPREEETNAPSRVVRLYFDGSGFAFGFHLGVASYLRDRYDLSRCELLAVSGGCLAALALALDLDPTELVDSGALERYFDDFTESTPCFGALGDLSAIARALDDWLPADAHVRITNLKVVVSPWPALGFKVLGPRFSSRDALVRAVVAACAFPGFARAPFRLDDACVFDAGYQSILDPLDAFVDLSVRPMPIIECCVSTSSTHRASLGGDVNRVDDPAARRLGHRVAYDSSVYPEGAAVWDGGRPPASFAIVKDLVAHAKLQAAASSRLARALDGKLPPRRRGPDQEQGTTPHLVPVVAVDPAHVNVMEGREQ